MNYLEKVSPSTIEILMPLKDWRILSLADLKLLTGYSRSQSSFYKLISKLEKNNLIESFINSWTNEKFLYLLPDGESVVGSEKLLPVNRDQRFHDSICTKVALNLNETQFFKEIYLDHNIPKHFPLMDKTPDILVCGANLKDFKIAIEIELTQKSKTRMEDIFKKYSDSKVVNNIIYITDKHHIFSAY